MSPVPACDLPPPTRWRAAAWPALWIAPTAVAHTPGADPGGGAATAWSFEPWVIASLLFSAGLYAWGLARLWRRAGRGHGLQVVQASAFAGGWWLLIVALVSPLDALGERSFAAHMVQHELLMLGAAPLLVMGRPLGAWAWALPAAWRAGVGTLFRHPGWRTPWRLLTGAGGAWLTHALAVWLWHVPALFEAALHDGTVHTWQHLSFLLTALLFWWSVLGASTAGRQGVALLSTFTTMVHTGALGALLTFARVPWYPHYLHTAPVFGLDALSDQQLGGLVMWVPAGAVYLVVALALGARWLSPRGGRTRHAADGAVAVPGGASQAFDGRPLGDRQTRSSAP